MLVVPSLDGIDIPAVKAAVTTRLADYRRPRWITGFGAPLPRTLGGKIVKREIRSHYPAVPAGAASLQRRDVDDRDQAAQIRALRSIAEDLSRPSRDNRPASGQAGVLESNT